MASTTLAFKATQEARAFIGKLSEKYEVPLSQIMGQFAEQAIRGDFTYNPENGWTCTKERSEETLKEPPKAPVQDGIDLSRLYFIANKRRITPQSLLDSALRIYP